MNSIMKIVLCSGILTFSFEVLSAVGGYQLSIHQITLVIWCSFIIVYSFASLFNVNDIPPFSTVIGYLFVYLCTTFLLTLLQGTIISSILNPQPSGTDVVGYLKSHFTYTFILVSVFLISED